MREALPHFQKPSSLYNIEITHFQSFWYNSLTTGSTGEIWLTLRIYISVAMCALKIICPKTFQHTILNLRRVIGWEWWTQQPLHSLLGVLMNPLSFLFLEWYFSSFGSFHEFSLSNTHFSGLYGFWGVFGFLMLLTFPILLISA